MTNNSTLLPLHQAAEVWNDWIDDDCYDGVDLDNLLDAIAAGRIDATRDGRVYVDDLRDLEPVEASPLGTLKVSDARLQARLEAAVPVLRYTQGRRGKTECVIINADFAVEVVRLALEHPALVAEALTALSHLRGDERRVAAACDLVAAAPDPDPVLASAVRRMVLHVLA